MWNTTVGSQDEVDPKESMVFLADHGGRLQSLLEGMRGVSKVWGHTDIVG
jgi:hypothetical protein